MTVRVENVGKMWDMNSINVDNCGTISVMVSLAMV